MLKIKWVKSSFADEKGEFERVAKDFSNAKDVKKNTDYLKKAYKESNPVFLQDSVWKKMENTGSYDITTIEKLQSQLKKDKVTRDITRILKQMIGEEVQCPIALQLADGSLTLIAGNTRLMVARMLEINPKICIVKSDW